MLSTIITVVVVAGFYGLYSLNISSTANTQSISTINTYNGATVRSIEDFGPQLSLQQAQSLSGVPALRLPTFLVDNLSLHQIRGESNLVAFVYESPNLPTVAGYDLGSLIILITNDGTSYYIPNGPVVVKSAIVSCSTISSNMTSCSTTMNSTVESGWSQQVTPLAISNNSGWGLTYQGTSLSFLTWWAGSIHYSATADLPLSTLASIAQSMNT